MEQDFFSDLSDKVNLCTHDAYEDFDEELFVGDLSTGAFLIPTAHFSRCMKCNAKIVLLKEVLRWELGAAIGILRANNAPSPEEVTFLRKLTMRTPGEFALVTGCSEEELKAWEQSGLPEAKEGWFKQQIFKLLPELSAGTP